MPLKKMILLLVVTLAACVRSTEPVRPQLAYPPTYSGAAASTAVTDLELTWWQGFGSPTLMQLIQRTDFSSLELQMAAERIRQAELHMRSAGASLFPAFDLTASSGEQHRAYPDSEAVNDTEVSRSSNINLGMNYELDLWGGLSAAKKSAAAGVQVAHYQRDALALSVKAALANAWFEWLTLAERIDTARTNITLAERIYNIVDARYRNGVANAADIAQQKTNLLTLQAALLPLQLQAQQTQSAMAILLGETPQTFTLTREDLMVLTVPTIAPGRPAELVTRRPDLAASESLLIAADADIIQARAALLPNIRLHANAGASASELFSLNPLTQTAGWSIALAQTLFNGGRLFNQQGYSQSRRAELLLQYHQNILIALQEVDNALLSADSRAQQEISQQAIVREAERTLSLTEVRYREGSGDLLSLLDAQRSLFQAQDLLVQQRLARLTAAVDLYKALGGG